MPSRKKADRKYHLKKKYGITEAHYEAMLRRQDGRCAICLRHRSSMRRRLAVDHDHKSKRVRGLLCLRCNYFLLGLSKGLTPADFRRAAEYMEHPPGVPWGVAGPPPFRVKSKRNIELGVLKRLRTKPGRKKRGPNLLI